ncbi:MAG: DUF4276 family protein [Chloroflexi bacterium]|nr:DUF4276 family protein [Chloroflexota bacterium]
MVSKLRGWQKPNCQFIVLRDQDSGDCKNIKAFLKQKCIEGNHPEALVRFACHELESWYLGDLSAVEQGLEIRGLSKHQKRSKFRDPDLVINPSKVLLKITKGNYQKVSGSRNIGSYLSAQKNQSVSFQFFSQGLVKFWQEGQ